MPADDARDIAKRWSVLCRDGQDPTRIYMKVNQKDGVVYTLKPRNVKNITLSKALDLHIEYKNPAKSTIDLYKDMLKTRVLNARFFDPPFA